MKLRDDKFTKKLGRKTPKERYICRPGSRKRKKFKDVGFEVFTDVVMESIIFWDVTPCSLSRFNRRFGGTYRLHFQGRRKFQQESANKQVAISTVYTASHIQFKDGS
jgi:hypothetical protein